jgi:hypothetical protein
VLRSRLATYIIALVIAAAGALAAATAQQSDLGAISTFDLMQKDQSRSRAEALRRATLALMAGLAATDAGRPRRW